jgi:hypothetical protein
VALAWKCQQASRIIYSKWMSDARKMGKEIYRQVRIEVLAQEPME